MLCQSPKLEIATIGNIGLEDGWTSSPRYRWWHFHYEKIDWWTEPNFYLALWMPDTFGFKSDGATLIEVLSVEFKMLLNNLAFFQIMTDFKTIPKHPCSVAKAVETNWLR